MWLFLYSARVKNPNANWRSTSIGLWQGPSTMIFKSALRKRLMGASFSTFALSRWWTFTLNRLGQRSNFPKNTQEKNLISFFNLTYILTYHRTKFIRIHVQRPNLLPSRQNRVILWLFLSLLLISIARLAPMMRLPVPHIITKGKLWVWWKPRRSQVWIGRVASRIRCLDWNWRSKRLKFFHLLLVLSC